MLALPAGIAAGKGTGWVPAIAVLMISGAMAGYTFYCIAKIVEATDAKDFKELWEKTLGEKTGWIMDFMIVALNFGCLIMYSCFIGDLGSRVFSMIPGAPAFLTHRSSVILGITTWVLLPLVLLRDLSALSASSIVGLVAVLYTAVFIHIRQADGSYAVGGEFYSQISEGMRPSDPSSLPSLLKMGLGTTVLVCMFSTSFMAHPNAVKFYRELKGRTIAKQRVVVTAANLLASLIYAYVMIMGFKTFGMNSQGLILNNYHQNADLLANFARVATGISIISSYPLLFAAYRESCISSLKSLANRGGFAGLVGKCSESAPTSDRAWFLITLPLIFSITLVSLVLTDIGLIVSLVGSLLGSALAFVTPAAMYLGLLRKDPSVPRSGSLVLTLHIVGLAGILLGVGGTIITLLNTFTDILQ